MKKSNVMKLFSLKRRGKRCVFTREIIGIFIFSSLLQLTANASDSYSQTAKINLRMRNADLEEVIWMIKKQTEFDFFYNSEDVKDIRGINVNLKNASAEEVLKYCLNGTNLTYQIVHKAITLKKIVKPVRITPKKIVISKNNSIKGKVTSQKDGQALPGVTVFIKGTTNGTVTDANGNYSLSDLPSDATLIFSLIGTQKQEIKIKERSILNVVLIEENTGLDEVVVVAYGTQKKVAVTGAVASVGSKELMQSSSQSLSNALSGKLSGLSALQNGGGRPSYDAATIYLRGVSTLNGASPLIMIDGVPRDNMDALDVNEVESVSILKDASATAVFGVRGANGVILITTKRGVEGKAQLKINLEQSYTSFTREPSRLHSVDYMNLRNQTLANDGKSAAFSDDVIAKFKNPLAGLDPNASDYAEQVKLRNYIYCDHDYYRELIRRYTPQTRASVDVTGGTKKVSYYINAGYIHQGGNLNNEPKSVLGYDPAEKMDRFTFRSNLDYKVTNSLSMFLNLGTYFEVDNSPNAGGLFNNSESYMTQNIILQAVAILPITPGPTTIAGYGVPAGRVVHRDRNMDHSPYEIINGRGYQNDYTCNLNSTLGATWDLSKAITPGLNMKGMISYDSYGGSTTQGAVGCEIYTANVDYTTNSLNYAEKNVPGTPLSITNLSYATLYKIDLQGSINYNHKFGKHEVGGLILAQRDYWEASGGSSVNLIPYNLIGLVGRATYNYDNRYFVEYDMGYNGSEQFAPKHRFGYFPAYSASWVLSNEEFLKGNQTLTNLKLRASYGKVGNDDISSARFLYLDDNTLVGGVLPTLGNNNTQVSMGLVGNPNLTWETAEKRNFGTDFSFFKNLSGSFDYFIEHRSDILITRNTVPLFQGVSSGNLPKANMGIVYNHGYEAELTYNLPVNKDLSFMFKGNYSFAKNVVKDADQVRRDSSYAVSYETQNEYTTGYSYGQCMGYLVDWKDHGGYWISQDEIKKSQLTYQNGIPRVGDFKYVDVNGDGAITDKDQVPIGYSSKVPEIIYGFTLGTTYKAFDFTIFFQGVAHYSMCYSGKNVYENATNDGSYFSYQMNSWTLDRYLKGEKITYPALSSVTTTNHTANSFFIMNRAFTRLKNIELGYTLPKNGLRALGISKLRVFVGGQNLYVWDHLKMSHLDPENNDPIGYPSTKMWNFGLNVTF